MTSKRKPASSPIETEAKIRVPSLMAVRRCLVASDGRRINARAFESNTLFDWPASSIRAAGKSFRVRRYGASGSITLKGVAQVAGGLRSRVELESEVSDPGMIAQILVSLGFIPQFRYEKFREVWKAGRATVCLDETPAGLFVEIEGTSAAIHRVAATLGLASDRFLSASYPALWVESGRRGDMVFAPKRRAALSSPRAGKKRAAVPRTKPIE